MKTSLRHTKSPGALCSIGIGILISVALYLLFSAIMAAVIGTLENPLGSLGIASMLSFFPTAFISGFLISKLTGEGGTLIAVASSFIFILALFLCCTVLTHGKIPFTLVVSYIAYEILAFIGGILGKKRSKHRHRA